VPKWNINERTVLIGVVLVVICMRGVANTGGKKMFVSLESSLPEGVEGTSFCSYLQNAIKEFDYVNCVRDTEKGGKGSREELSIGSFPEDGIDFLDYECRYLFSHHCRDGDFKEAVMKTNPKVVVTIPMEYSDRFGEPHDWLVMSGYTISPMYYHEVYSDLDEFKLKIIEEKNAVERYGGTICPSLWGSEADTAQRLDFIKQNFDCWVVWEVVDL